jgi:hypothetical protein
MTRRIEFAMIVLANLFIAAAYLLQQAWPGVLICLILACSWIAASLRRFRFINPVFFLILALLAAFSMLGGNTPLLSFLGFLFGIAAWDLTYFSDRLRQIVPGHSAARVEKLHLRRLFATLFLGLVAGLAGIFIHIQISFNVASLLVILAFVAFATFVRTLFKKDPGKY